MPRAQRAAGGMGDTGRLKGHCDLIGFSSILKLSQLRRLMLQYAQ